MTVKQVLTGKGALSAELHSSGKLAHYLSFLGMMKAARPVNNHVCLPMVKLYSSAN